MTSVIRKEKIEIIHSFDTLILYFLEGTYIIYNIKTQQTLHKETSESCARALWKVTVRNHFENNINDW